MLVAWLSILSCGIVRACPLVPFVCVVVVFVWVGFVGVMFK